MLPLKCYTDGNNYFLNVHHHKDALLTYIQLAVQQQSVPFFTKQLLSFLSQVLNVV